MLNCFVTTLDSLATPILLIPQKLSAEWLAKQNDFTKNWLFTTNNLRWEPGTTLLLPNSDGKIGRVVLCLADERDFWSVGSLPFSLPPGVYRLEQPADVSRFALAWGLGAYQFTRYKASTKTAAQLFLPDAASAASIFNVVESIYWVRDLINTPTDDMGPSELAHEAVLLAKDYGAKLTQLVGPELLKNNYASIYTVGRASDDPPRLVEFRWGNKNHPKLTLVGKGVCFDTGGLDLKPASGMALMKKDMAGAAHVLGLARMIMQEKLPVYLRVLVPIVENAVSGNAYRPGDVIKSRKGLTIEIGNTDAEGRLILADALAEAANDKPELLIDMATLTGAARVALGTELAALFTNRDEIAEKLLRCAEQELDPMWRLPLFRPYRELLNSAVADINNASSEAYGGAITAAVFLKEFVPEEVPWIHFDMMAWNSKGRPGRPAGGEANALRALLAYLKNRFAPSTS
jgi:leucyl aminopeptidase